MTTKSPVESAREFLVKIPQESDGLNAVAAYTLRELIEYAESLERELEELRGRDG